MNKEEEVHDTKNGITLTKPIENSLIHWPENVTVLDLSWRNMHNIQDDIKLPPNLHDLDLSHNNFQEVPRVVSNLKLLRTLDLSYNCINFFDNVPEFYNCIERLDLSNNALNGPPYWIWTQSPNKLFYLNLCSNKLLTSSFVLIGYLDELLTYTAPATEINLHNCCLKNRSLKLLSTFTKAKNIVIGKLDYNYLSTNYVIELPFEGLDKLCDIERLIACNAHIYTINCNIVNYKSLIEINLSENNIHSLPNEFCYLVNLEICRLSHNKLLYLPDNIVNLIKLKVLSLDSNGICMLPENISDINSLRILDLYNNCLSEVSPSLIDKVTEIDLAQNYLEEPDDDIYKVKRNKLRMDKLTRDVGRYKFYFFSLIYYIMQFWPEI